MKNYESPKMTAITIELEQGIAAGSNTKENNGNHWGWDHDDPNHPGNNGNGGNRPW